MVIGNNRIHYYIMVISLYVLYESDNRACVYGLAARLMPIMSLLHIYIK